MRLFNTSYPFRMRLLKPTQTPPRDQSKTLSKRREKRRAVAVFWRWHVAVHIQYIRIDGNKEGIVMRIAFLNIQNDARYWKIQGAILETRTGSADAERPL